jgi:response regulator NasT
MEYAKTTSPRWKVIIADSDPFVRRSLKETLEKRPEYQVTGEAATGSEMVQMVLAVKPDLVIFDVQLPQLNGLDALRQIRQQQFTAAVALTADCNRVLLRRVLAEGVLALFLKPVEEYQLDPALRVALAQFEELRRLTAENKSLYQTLQNRIAIERAKGILMREHRWSESEALRRLQRLALAQHLTLAEVAQTIINGADIEQEAVGVS